MHTETTTMELPKSRLLKANKHACLKDFRNPFTKRMGYQPISVHLQTKALELKSNIEF